MKVYFLIVFIVAMSQSAKAQEYYEFGNKEPSDKGKFSITPSVGLQIQKIEESLPLGSVKFLYHFHENISAGVQYIYMQPPKRYFKNFVPNHTAVAVVSGQVFPFNNFGFQAAAGLAYVVKPDRNVTYYGDFGLAYRIGHHLTLQLNILELDLVTGAALAVQIKL